MRAAARMNMTGTKRWGLSLSSRVTTNCVIVPEPEWVSARGARFQSWLPPLRNYVPHIFEVLGVALARQDQEPGESESSFISF